MSEREVVALRARAAAGGDQDAADQLVALEEGEEKNENNPQ